ncbi:MAG: molybdopterin-guanine dinucleotide biosynthesis protein B [Pseudomonadota bacterium]
MSAGQASPKRPPIIGIAGWKKSGKTTLTERLIETFAGRGLRVCALKHAHHNFQIDDDATDSARHRRAGAAQVAVVSARRWAMIGELDEGEDEPDFDDVIGWFGPCDLIVVEGYKSAAIPKIEARREASRTRKPLAPDDPLVIAIAADHAVSDEGVPTFTLDDVDAIADFLTHRFALARPAKVTP